MPPVEEAGGGEAQVLERVDGGGLERGVVERGNVPEPHGADVRDDAEGRVAEGAGRPLEPVDPLRGGPQDPLGQREREHDRRQVGEQQVLDHVEGRELLAEPVERRDERDEQRRDPDRPQRQPPIPGRSGTALRPRSAPPEAIDDRVGDQREQDDGGEAPRDVDCGHARIVGRRTTATRRRPKLSHPRARIVTPAWCFVTWFAQRSEACRPAFSPSCSRSSSRPRAWSAGRRSRARISGCAPSCTRALPWLACRTCPRCGLPSPSPRRLPGRVGGVSAGVGAAGPRGRGARPRRGAQVPRRAPRRGADGGARRREPPVRHPAISRGDRAGPAAAGARTPARLRSRRRAGGCARAAARRPRRRVPTPPRPGTAPGRRDASAAAPRRPHRDRAALAAARRGRCSSTTSIRPERPSTPAPRALIAGGCDEVVARHLHANAMKRGTNGLA